MEYHINNIESINLHKRYGLKHVGIDLCLFWIDDRDLRSKRMFSFLLHCIQKSFCDYGGKEK